MSISKGQFFGKIIIFGVFRVFTREKSLDIIKEDYFEKNFWKKSHSNVVTPIYEVSNDYQRFDIKIQYKIGLMIIFKMFLIEKWFL